MGNYLIKNINLTIMVSKFTKAIMMGALALLVCSDFVMAEETKTGDKTSIESSTSLSATAMPSQYYFIRINGISWCLFIMLYLALTAAWKIVEDNKPDTQKDSILYAKFLTQSLSSKPNCIKIPK